MSFTEKQSVAKTQASAYGLFSGEQCPVDKETRTKDAARLSEISRPICHTHSVSEFTLDQGLE